MNKQREALAILGKMISFTIHSLAPVAGRSADRRLIGALITVLIHVALILGWQMARRLPSAQPERAHSTIQWIDLPALVPPAESAPAARAGDAPARSRAAPARSARPAMTAIPALPPPAPAAPAAAEPVADPFSAAEVPDRSGAEAIMENARRSAGSIDRALRKENRPYITAPLNSLQVRMRNGMEQAHAMAPPRLSEAPKVEEMVNQTGDGARRTRVITGNGTYCVTERSPATSIDMIEKHGKLRFTNCPQHEEPAKQQKWRTARD